MRLHPVGRLLARHASQRAAPAGDGRETRRRGADATTGQSLEHDRLADAAPGDAATRHVAERLADVFADAEVEIVIAEPILGEPGGMPELRVAGIEVDEDAAAEPRLERGVGEVAADVHEHVGSLRDVGQGSPRRAETAALALDDERRVESEVRRDGVEVRQVHRALDRARRAADVDARGRRDLFEEEHVVTQPLEAERPRQPRPGRTAIGRLVGEGPGHDDGGHANQLRPSFRTSAPRTSEDSKCASARRRAAR